MNNTLPTNVIKRDCSIVAFDIKKIDTALSSALAATRCDDEEFDHIHTATMSFIEDDLLTMGDTVTVEAIQNCVEINLAELGHMEVLRVFMIYRNAHDKLRLKRRINTHASTQFANTVLTELSSDLVNIDVEELLSEINIEHQQPHTPELYELMLLTTKGFITIDPDYGRLAARLLLKKTNLLVEERLVGDNDPSTYNLLSCCLHEGWDAEIYTKKLKVFDLDVLYNHLNEDNNLLFTYLGIQSLVDRYLMRDREKMHIETPQICFMRIAMGLSYNRTNPDQAAMETYDLISTFKYMHSTPTLFNSGLTSSQLSSCYLTTMPDDLHGIFKGYSDDAQLSKYAGGIANAFTPVRASGAKIKGTNGYSHGVIPFIKIVDSLCIAVNQCVSPDTVVHTKRGPRYIKDIVDNPVNHQAYGLNGIPNAVTEGQVFPTGNTIVSVSTKYQTQPLRCTYNHPLLILKDNNEAHWVLAENVKVGDMMLQPVPEYIDPKKLTMDPDAIYDYIDGLDPRNPDAYIPEYMMHLPHDLTSILVMELLPYINKGVYPLMAESYRFQLLRLGIASSGHIDSEGLVYIQHTQSPGASYVEARSSCDTTV